MITQHTVKMDGETYPPGSTIDVKDPKERERLIARGAIADDPPPPPRVVVEEGVEAAPAAEAKSSKGKKTK